MPQKVVFLRNFLSYIIWKAPWKELFLAKGAKILYDGPMKKFLHSFRRISPAGLWAVRNILALCCAMVFGAFVLCLSAGEPCAANFRAYSLARAMADAPAGVLLLAGVGLMILEDPATKR